MKRLCFIAFTLLSILSLPAQEEEKVSVKLYGFFRNDAFVDSYKGLNSSSDLFYLVPLFSGIDSNGDHFNQQTSSNISSMSTRFGFAVTGPHLFNAKTSGVMETDFSGNPSSLTALLRLRKAYINFKWEKSSLLFGQNWHPFWTGSIFPSVGSLNTGAPFQPFNRSPQLRFDYQLNEHFSVNGSAVYEFQYLSRGPEGKSDQYARNAALPELVAGLEGSFGDISVGIFASYKQIKPRLYHVVGEEQFNSNDMVQSQSALGYVQYKSGDLVLKAKTVYGENLAHLLMPSGYGVSSYNTQNGETGYTPYQHSYSFFNAVYGQKWQLGFFAGYGLNLGTNTALYNYSSISNPSTETYGFLQNIQSLYRVAPHVALNVGKFRMVLEYEYTSVDYGTGTINLSDGLYNNTVTAANNRAVFVMFYYF